MKNLFKLFGIIAFIAIIGFAFIGCPNDPGGSGPGPDPDPNPNPNPTPPTPTIGTYAGKDLLGNKYSLSVESFGPAASYSRAAARGDRYTMTVTPRDGKPRTVTGTVADVSEDGTFTLDTTGDDFTAVVDGSGGLNSVAGTSDLPPEIPFTGDPIGGSQTLTPRTFNDISLRATRWTNESEGSSGEHWGSGLSVLLRDYPANVSSLQVNGGDRYTITMSGTSDTDLQYINIEVQGLKEDDSWQWLTGYTDGYLTATAGTPFSHTIQVNGVSSVTSLLDYKEIILQVTNVMKYEDTAHPDWNKDNGGIPEEIETGTIMATISDFKIELKDTSRTAFAGNMPDFTYGIQEDGMSVDYRQAVWNLSSANIAEAKKAGSKFEFITHNVDLSTKSAVLGFAWQDPVRGLWWQDEINLCGWNDMTNQWEPVEGVEWISHQKKVRIDLDAIIEDSRFDSATSVNFVIGYWWHNGLVPPNEDLKFAVDELSVTGANIIAAPAPSTGNMGSYYYGYQENGISFETNQAVWHLPEAALTAAKEAGAKLKIVFNSTLEEDPTLALVWQGIDSSRWWPTDAEAGIDSANLKILEGGTPTTGVEFVEATQTLTVTLETALETYDSFKNATDANLILAIWWPANSKIDVLGIVSANIE